jgi:predicted hydrocarbon binding protein
MAGNSILDELVYYQVTGSLTYRGMRYILMRPETIIGFQKAIEEHNPVAAKDAFFKGGYRGGYLTAKKLKQNDNFSNTEVIDFMMKMGRQIGWGHFKLDEYDPKTKFFRITVEKSAFAEAYGVSTEGVCHLTRGVLSGLGTILFSKNCVALEHKCLAKGDGYCVFEVSVSDGLRPGS